MELTFTVDPQEEQQAEEYEELLPNHAVQPPIEETGAFDENLNDETGAEVDDPIYDSISVGGSNIELGANFSAAGYTPDISVAETEPVQANPFTTREVKRITFPRKDFDLSKFQLAMGLMAHVTGMSRPEYKMWTEMLCLVRDDNGNPVSDLIQLPKQLATLKTRVTRQLPLLDMRLTQIPLDPTKLHTETATRKRELAEAVARAKAQAEGTIEDDIHNAEAGMGTKDDSAEILTNLWFFDPECLFKAFLCSDAARNMHKGMAHFVDTPKELHHARCWSSSIRATSGEYAHFKNEDGSDGDAIFPGDFVYYWCLDEDDCHLGCDLEDDIMKVHIGRVMGVGRDYFDEPIEEDHGILLQIVECVTGQTIFRVAPEAFDNKRDWEDNELIMAVTSAQYIPESQIGGWASVVIDRYTGETFEDPSPPIKKRKQTFPKYRRRPAFRTGTTYMVKRFFYHHDDDSKTLSPMAHTHPVRAELEVEEYGREYFASEWDAKNADYDVMSCPVTTFIDGFGLYSNSYRSLMGLYMTPALPLEDRLRPLNNFPILLGPHGSDFNDVIKALECLLPLDKGIFMTINGRKTLVNVFTMCYTADTPQNDKNAGGKGPMGLKFCRFCHIGETHQVEKMDVISEFDVNEHGKYHHQCIQMRHEMDHHLTLKRDKTAYGTQWGVSEVRPSLFDISPAADIVLTRPPDPAHSEYKGLAGSVHELLIDGLLTNKAKKEYTVVLRTWPFPASWPHLMSPAHHLLSYSLSDHARWSIIVPGLLRSWLRKEHIDPLVWPYLEKIFVSDDDEDEDEQHREEAVIMGLIKNLFAAMAKSNSVLMGRSVSAEDLDNLHDIINRPRMCYSKVCRAVAMGILDNPKSGKGPGETRQKARRHRAQAEANKQTAQGNTRRPNARTTLRAQALIRLHERSVEEGRVNDADSDGDADDDMTDAPRRSQSTSPGADNPASRASASVEPEDDDDGASVPEDEEARKRAEEDELSREAAVKNMPRRALDFFNAAQRPTIHIGMHFLTFFEEYGLTAHCNVLPGENEHK